MISALFFINVVMSIALLKQKIADVVTKPKKLFKNVMVFLCMHVIAVYTFSEIRPFSQG